MIRMANLILNAEWNKKIEILRVLNGWTQKEAAERCGTTPKVYWLWENGICMPRRNSKIAISRAFEVNLNDIFNE